MRKGRASRTAMMVACWRAFADRGVTSVPGFRDPFARRLLDGLFWRLLLARADAMVANPQSRSAAGMRPWIDGIALRVAFLDAVITDAEPGPCVILGAGLDTRVWRLEGLRGATVFEVDHPSTQTYKRDAAADLEPPLADVRWVPVDFTRDDLGTALEAAGHDTTLPTVWVWEGVVMYLDDAALRGTLAVVRQRSAAGSVLAVHYHEPERTRRASTVRKLLFSWLGEPQIGLRTAEVMASELTRAGFEQVEDAGLREQAARRGAPTPADHGLKVSRILVVRVPGP